MEEGTESDIPGHEFGLIIGQKVAFRFLSSSTRKNDTLGTILDEWDDEVHEISPLQLTLESPERMPAWYLFTYTAKSPILVRLSYGA